MTIRSVIALSLNKARLLSPRNDAVMISILGHDEAHSCQRPESTGWGDMLFLEFEDASEESVLARPGAWPDEPTDDQNKLLMGKEGRCVPSMSHANQIAHFVLHNHVKKDMVDLIVHCYAGTSRSVMVASKVVEWMNLPMDRALLPLIPHANARLGRLLDKAKPQFLTNIL